MTLFPRIQLFEFMDLPWCPEWFRVYAQSFLVGLWNLSIPSISVSTFAAAASDTILENFPGLSSFTFVDLCTGAGGPTPLIESRLHNSLRQQGKSAARFVLTDLYPALEQWRDIAAKHENITYVEEALDARNCKRIAGPGRKEGRMLTASFHHLDDETAVAVLGYAIREADAFTIQEGVQRDITSLLTCLFGCLFYPLVYTLAAPQYQRSPVHLLFTYLIPLISVIMAFDGVVSAARCRTPRQIEKLVERTGLDVREWEFRSGRKACIRRVLCAHWFAGMKRGAMGGGQGETGPDIGVAE